MTIRAFVATLIERVLLVLWFCAGLLVAILGVLVIPLGLVNARWVRRANCMHHAYSHYRRGGYVLLRRSYFWRGPHMMAGPTPEALEEFSPVTPKYERLVPPPFFDGTVAPFDRSKERCGS